MYMTARETVGQLPMRSCLLTGTLGNNPRPPAVQAFLDRVSKRPQDYKGLLLTIVLHPDPKASEMYIFDPVLGGYVWVDFLLLFGITAADFDELRRIANKSFGRKIEAELKLRNKMFQVTGRIVRDELLKNNQKVSKKLEPILLKASDLSTNPFRTSLQVDLGRWFAVEMIPAKEKKKDEAKEEEKLRKKITSGEVPEVHLSWLGKLLGRYAEELQKRDAGFKRLVEQKRKKKP